MNNLLCLSPLDGRYQDYCQDLAAIFSEFGLTQNRVLVEIAWFKHLSLHPEIEELPRLSDSALRYLDTIVDDFDLAAAARIKDIEHSTKHDVKAVEYYLAEKFREHPELQDFQQFIHFACTSEDINNLARSLQVKKALEKQLLPNLQKIAAQLLKFAETNKSVVLLAHTHGQAASPTSFGKEIYNFYARMQGALQELQQFQLTAKFNGAVGNFNAHYAAYPKINWPEVSNNFVSNFGLACNLYTTQIEPYDNLSSCLQLVSRINTILLDYSKDMWTYISLGYLKLHHLPGEVGSSTMPHKINPINFENAEGNLGIANSLFNFLIQKLPISRLQRDLSDSTCLRNLGVGFGYCLVAYANLITASNKIAVDYENISYDLCNNWQVVAEAIQTIMRKHNLPTPYEQLQALTQGNIVTREDIIKFIKDLNIPEQLKEELLQVSPENYCGFATTFNQTSEP